MGEIYDAIHNAACRNIGYFDGQQLCEEIASSHLRPSVLFRPSLSVDGNQFCVLYGTDLQSGIAGFGDTPDKAMRDFDKSWVNFDISKK